MSKTGEKDSLGVSTPIHYCYRKVIEGGDNCLGLTV